jgi:hypothetical protein
MCFLLWDLQVSHSEQANGGAACSTLSVDLAELGGSDDQVGASVTIRSGIEGFRVRV